MNFYFTFGQAHKHPATGEEMKDYYIKIKSDTAENAREIMFDHYGDKWAFMYTEKIFQPQAYPNGCYEEIERMD